MRKKKIIAIVIITIIIFSLIITAKKVKADTNGDISTALSSDGINVPVPKGFIASPFSSETYVNGSYTYYNVSDPQDVTIPTEDSTWTYTTNSSLGISYYAENATSPSTTITPIEITAPIGGAILEIEWFGYTNTELGNIIYPTLVDTKTGNSSIIETFAGTILGSNLRSSSIWINTTVLLEGSSSSTRDYTLEIPEFYNNSVYTNNIYIKSMKIYPIESKILDTSSIDETDESIKKVKTNSGGFVIYQTDNKDNLTSQATAKEKYNQWVWVPVSQEQLNSYKTSNIKNNFYGYTFSPTSIVTRETNDQEIVNRYDLTKRYLSKYTRYLKKNDLTRDEQSNYSDMMESIKKYGGFTSLVMSYLI